MWGTIDWVIKRKAFVKRRACFHHFPYLLVLLLDDFSAREIKDPGPVYTA